MFSFGFSNIYSYIYVTRWQNKNLLKLFKNMTRIKNILKKLFYIYAAGCMQAWGLFVVPNGFAHCITFLTCLRSQAFLNTDCLLTYKYRKNNVLKAALHEPTSRAVAWDPPDGPSGRLQCCMGQPARQCHPSPVSGRHWPVTGDIDGWRVLLTGRPDGPSCGATRRAVG